MKPSDVAIDPGGIITATLGRAELEMAAALIVRWHHLHSPADWSPFSRADIATLFDGDGDEHVHVWARNPFFRPDAVALSTGGFVVGWTPGRERAADKGTVTVKFLEALAKRFGPRRTLLGVWIDHDNSDPRVHIIEDDAGWLRVVCTGDTLMQFERDNIVAGESTCEACHRSL